jgi:hypothetical protein
MTILDDLHHVERLQVARGVLGCRARGRGVYCEAPATFVIFFPGRWYAYGRRARLSSRRCERHAREYAERYALPWPGEPR